MKIKVALLIVLPAIIFFISGATSLAQSSPTNFFIEAESAGLLENGTTITSDNLASDQSAITSSVDDQGDAHFNNAITDDGTYYFWLRMKNTQGNTATNNVVVSVDGTTFITNATASVADSAGHPWKFAPVMAGGSKGSAAIAADADIAIDLHNATAGTMVDMIILTDDANYTPKINDFSPQADIRITKSVDKSTAQSGEMLTYTLTATNNGEANSREAYIGDAIPTNVTIVSASEAYETVTIEGRDIIGFGPYTIRPGETHTVTLVVRIN